MNKIDFEKDQENVLQKTTSLQSLADQVERLETMQHELEIREDALNTSHKKLIFPIEIVKVDL